MARSFHQASVAAPRRWPTLASPKTAVSPAALCRTQLETTTVAAGPDVRVVGDLGLSLHQHGSGSWASYEAICPVLPPRTMHTRRQVGSFTTQHSTFDCCCCADRRHVRKHSTFYFRYWSAIYSCHVLLLKRTEDHGGDFDSSWWDAPEEWVTLMPGELSTTCGQPTLHARLRYLVCGAP